MTIKYKKQCMKCKKNYVLATWRTNYVLCYDCQKKELEGNIKDQKMKKLFNIPEKYYKDNAFLRSIKINYLRFRNLSDKQIQMFKETLKKMKEDKD